MSAHAKLRAAATPAALIVPAVVVGALTFSRSLEYGHFPNWWYFADRPLLGKAVALALVGGALAAAATWALVRAVERREALSVAACVVGGFVLQLATFWANSTRPGKIVTDRDNDFYQAARQVPRIDRLLRHWDDVRKLLPLHASTNMPGKVVAYQLLLHISTSSTTLAYLLAIFAALGGLLVYFLAREIFDDRRSAIIATALYFVIPARLIFLLFANNMTAVLIVALFLLALLAVRTARLDLALGAGLLLYSLVFFEPTPIVLAPTFLVLVLRKHAQPIARLVAPAIAAVAAFFAAHLLMLAVYGFNVFGAASFVLRDARDFNLRAKRGYLAFLPANAREFVIQAGLVTTLIVLAAFVAAVVALIRRRRTFVATLEDPLLAMPLALGLTLAWLLFVGTSRGEITRLWIYLAVFFTIAGAALMRRMAVWVAPAAAFVSFSHAVVAAGTLSFISPRTICHDCGAIPKHVYRPVLDVVLVGAVVALTWVMRRSTPSDERILERDQQGAEVPRS